jgi:hypothetical protein
MSKIVVSSKWLSSPEKTGKLIMNWLTDKYAAVSRKPSKAVDDNIKSTKNRNISDRLAFDKRPTTG